MPIYVNNEQDKKEVTAELIEQVTLAAQTAYAKEGIDPEKEVSIIFIDNKYIRQLNRDYRQKDSATDVLSFAINEPGEGEPDVIGAETEELLGDIFISLEKAEVQAADYGHSFTREVVYLAVHGILHLIGFDHEEEQDKLIMRTHEEQIMSDLNLNR